MIYQFMIILTLALSLGACSQMAVNQAENVNHMILGSEVR